MSFSHSGPDLATRDVIFEQARKNISNKTGYDWKRAFGDELRLEIPVSLFEYHSSSFEQLRSVGLQNVRSKGLFLKVEIHGESYQGRDHKTIISIKDELDIIAIAKNEFVYPHVTRADLENVKNLLKKETQTDWVIHGNYNYNIPNMTCAGSLKYEGSISLSLDNNSISWQEATKKQEEFEEKFKLRLRSATLSRPAIEAQTITYTLLAYLSNPFAIQIYNNNEVQLNPIDPENDIPENENNNAHFLERAKIYLYQLKFNDAVYNLEAYKDEANPDYYFEFDSLYVTAYRARAFYRNKTDVVQRSYAIADYTQAITHCEKNRLDPSRIFCVNEANLAELYFARGNVHALNKDFAKALDDYNQALNYFSEVADAFSISNAMKYSFAILPYFLFKGSQRIAASFMLSNNIDRAFLEIIYQRAKAYAETKKIEKAIVDYSHIIKFGIARTEFKDILIQATLARAEIYEQMGDVQKALDDYKSIENKVDNHINNPLNKKICTAIISLICDSYNNKSFANTLPNKKKIMSLVVLYNELITRDYSAILSHQFFTQYLIGVFAIAENDSLAKSVSRKAPIEDYRIDKWMGDKYVEFYKQQKSNLSVLYKGIEYYEQALAGSEQSSFSHEYKQEYKNKLIKTYLLVLREIIDNLHDFNLHSVEPLLIKALQYYQKITKDIPFHNEKLADYLHQFASRTALKASLTDEGPKLQLNCCNISIEMNPHRAEYYETRGNIYYRCGKAYHKEAFKNYVIAIDNRAYLHKNDSLWLLMFRDFDQLIPLFQQFAFTKQTLLLKDCLDETSLLGSIIKAHPDRSIIEKIEKYLSQLNPRYSTIKYRSLFSLTTLENNYNKLDEDEKFENKTFRSITDLNL